MIDPKRIKMIIDILNTIEMTKQNFSHITKERVEQQILINTLYSRLNTEFTKEELLLSRDLLDKNVSARKIKHHLLNEYDLNKKQGKNNDDYLEEVILAILGIVKGMGTMTRHNLWVNMLLLYKSRIEGGNYEYREIKATIGNNK